MLALAGLPRAGAASGDYQNIRALYFELLSKAGLTGQMLKSACQRYIMAPTGGKAKFFPDPGQIAEMCAEDIRDHRRDMDGLEAALALLDHPPAVEPEPDNGARLEQLRNIKQGLDPRPAHEANPLPSTARAETNVTELKAHLEKKKAS